MAGAILRTSIPSKKLSGTLHLFLLLLLVGFGRSVPIGTSKPSVANSPMPPSTAVLPATDTVQWYLLKWRMLCVDKVFRDMSREGVCPPSSSLSGSAVDKPTFTLFGFLSEPTIVINFLSGGTTKVFVSLTFSCGLARLSPSSEAWRSSDARVAYIHT